MVPEAPPTDLRRLNADGRPFKAGDVREDGYIFRVYEKKRLLRKDFTKNPGYLLKRINVFNIGVKKQLRNGRQDWLLNEDNY
jgi:hypothetical protein